MAVKTKSVRNAEIDATYINNITQNTDNSDLNKTYRDNADSSISIAAGEPEQDCAEVVNFLKGIKDNGEPVVSLCNTIAIKSAQNWIDNSTLIAPDLYQLEANKTYLLCGSVSRSFSLMTNGFNTLLGGNPNIDVDLYTGSGTAWQDSAAFDGLTILRCSSKGVAGAGSKFLSQTNGSFIISTDTCFIEHDDLGTTDAIVNVHSKVAFGSLSIPILTGYVITSQNTPTISFDNCAMRMTSVAAVTALDMTTATSVSSITVDMAFRGGEFAGSIGVKGAPNSGNLLADARGLIRDSNFRTVNIPLSGITIEDLKWTLRDNDGIEDTMPDAHATCMDRVTSTLISVVDTPVEVGGGSASADPLDDWFSVRESQFQLDTETGRITYLGLDPIRVPVDFGCTVDPDSGTNKNVYIYIGFGGSGDPNPTAIEDSRSEINVDSGDPQPITTFTQITFNTGDYISPMIAIKTGTSVVDVLCTNNKLRIN